MTTITKHHKLGGLKQYKWIRSQFWRLQVWNLGVGGLYSLPSHQNRILPCFFQLLVAPQLFLALWQHHVSLRLSLHPASSLSSFSSVSHKDTCHWI